MMVGMTSIITEVDDENSENSIQAVAMGMGGVGLISHDPRAKK